MLKALYKNLIWIALPLGLAMGCAENRSATEAAFTPVPEPQVVLQPTSSEPESRIYSSSNPAAENTGVTVTAPPQGASPQNWAIGQEIREKLTADETLAPLGRTFIASVDQNGVVTLWGNIRNSSEQRRLVESISSLPGVQEVNNQLGRGKYRPARTVNMQ